ncbi:MAG: hypothetical protein KAS32_10845 [Candidatus Peribacteraceae bacterium]|nr:hypothetical protein [Candidatus Peribacteraceae bacterium]
MHWIMYARLGLFVLEYLKRPEPDDKASEDVRDAINGVSNEKLTTSNVRFLHGLARALLKEIK